MAETLKKGSRVTGAASDKLAADLKKKYDQGQSIRALAESTGAEVIAYFPVKAETVGGGDHQRRDLIARRAGPGETTLAARLGARTRAQTGEPLRVAIDASRLHFFDADSESAIW